MIKMIKLPLVFLIVFPFFLPSKPNLTTTVKMSAEFPYKIT